MSDRVFLDTNILVYAYDAHDQAKQQRSQALLADGMAQENAVISAQVLGEFYVVMTRRVQPPLTHAQAASLVELLRALPVVDTDAALVERAVHACGAYQLSYWDSLIVAAAERAECATLLTEDLNPDQNCLGVTIRNPFRG